MIGGALVAVGASFAALLVVASGLLPGIYVEGRVGVTLLIAAVIFCLLNALVRPVLRLLSCPWALLLAAFVLFVMNALLLLLTALITEWLAQPVGGRLVVTGFGWAVVGGVIVSVIVTLLTGLYDRWATRVTVPPPPDVRGLAAAKRAELDQEFDAAVGPPKPPPAP